MELESLRDVATGSAKVQEEKARGTRLAQSAIAGVLTVNGKGQRSQWSFNQEPDGLEGDQKKTPDGQKTRAWNSRRTADCKKGAKRGEQKELTEQLREKRGKPPCPRAAILHTREEKER